MIFLVEKNVDSENKRTTLEKELIKIYNKKDKNQYFCSFIALDRIQVNINNKYDTPTGIYCYPIMKYLKVEKDEYDNKNAYLKEFPFATNQPYCAIFKIKNSDYKKMWGIKNFKQSDYDENITKVIDYILKNRKEDYIKHIAKFAEIDDPDEPDIRFYNAGESSFTVYFDEDENPVDLSNRDIKEMLECECKHAEQEALEGMDRGKVKDGNVFFDLYDSEDVQKNFVGKFFFTMNQLFLIDYFNILEFTEKNSSVHFLRKLYRKLGCFGFKDDTGTGFIHTNERIQAVVFYTYSLKNVKIYENDLYKEQTSQLEIDINKRETKDRKKSKEKLLEPLNQHKNIKDFKIIKLNTRNFIYKPEKECIDGDTIKMIQFECLNAKNITLEDCLLKNTSNIEAFRLYHCTIINSNVILNNNNSTSFKDYMNSSKSVFIGCTFKNSIINGNAIFIKCTFEGKNIYEPLLHISNRTDMRGINKINCNTYQLDINIKNLQHSLPKSDEIDNNPKLQLAYKNYKKQFNNLLKIQIIDKADELYLHLTISQKHGTDSNEDYVFRFPPNLNIRYEDIVNALSSFEYYNTVCSTMDKQTIIKKSKDFIINYKK